MSVLSRFEISGNKRLKAFLSLNKVKIFGDRKSGVLLIFEIFEIET